MRQISSAVEGEKKLYIRDISNVFPAPITLCTMNYRVGRGIGHQ